MIPASNITDAQIRELRTANGGSADVVKSCDEALLVAGRNGGYAIRRGMARARCAEILEARRKEGR